MADPYVPQPGEWLCRCGHPEEFHRHHRPGTDCGTCGPKICPRFRRAVRWE